MAKCKFPFLFIKYIRAQGNSQIRPLYFSEHSMFTTAAVDCVWPGITWASLKLTIFSSHRTKCTGFLYKAVLWVVNGCGLSSAPWPHCLFQMADGGRAEVRVLCCDTGGEMSCFLNPQESRPGRRPHPFISCPCLQRETTVSTLHLGHCVHMVLLEKVCHTKKLAEKLVRWPRYLIMKYFVSACLKMGK